MQQKLKLTDYKLIDEIFDASSGYVLDFSNKNFSDFFSEELNINIYDQKYEAGGQSKAKRLRYFLKISNNKEITSTLIALWNYRNSLVRLKKITEPPPELAEEFCTLIRNLGGTPPKTSSPAKNLSKNYQKIDALVCDQLFKQLINLSKLSPIQRGFGFERFLKDLFIVYGLFPRSSFRVVGEQIDGSFDLNSDIYLLEAKWTNKPVDAATLRAFNAKVEDKAPWSRGLFISESGFSVEGLTAYGKGKSVICMDGLDLSDMLQRNLHFGEIISKKVRYAAETGVPFVRIRDLY